MTIFYFSILGECMEITLTHNGKNLLIRQVTVDDASLLLSWWNNGEIMAHAGFPLGLKTTLEKVKDSITRADKKGDIFIIYCENIPIGEMSYKEDGAEFDFGIKICNKTFQNGGYGTAILDRFFEFLFNTKNAEKITCNTNLNNIRAQFVYEEKLKMKRVKTLYNNWTNQIGELCSTTFFEITKDEYFNNKK